MRRRALATGLAALALVALVALENGAEAVLGGGADAPASVRGRVPVVRYTVRPGDTLWRIAQRLEPRRDPRQVVDALVAARGGTQLRAGEVIEWAGL